MRGFPEPATSRIVRLRWCGTLSRSAAALRILHCVQQDLA